MALRSLVMLVVNLLGCLKGSKALHDPQLVGQVAVLAFHDFLVAILLDRLLETAHPSSSPPLPSIGRILLREMPEKLSRPEQGSA